MNRWFGFFILTTILISCVESMNPPATVPVIFQTHYDISGKEIDAPNACRNSVLRIDSRTALDSFVVHWTIATDEFNLDSIDFESRELLGVVTRRISHTPAFAKILRFEEYSDSLQVTIVSGCENCVLDSPSGDVLIVSFPKIQKPLKAVFNDKPIPTQASIKKFEDSPACLSED